MRVGLIGSGIGASLSPALHMNEGRAQGLDYRYDLLELSDPAGLPDLMEWAEAQGFAGVNVTHPFKQAVVPLLAGLDADAAALGAVNTVRFAGGRQGFNTDWWGFSQSLQRGLPGAALGQVVLVGAGGAGVAVGHALARLGAGRVTVFDADMGRAAALVARCGAGFQVGRDLAAAMAGADGLVHATPMGMAAHPGLALDPGLILARHWVADVVYVPLQTALVQAARARGARVLTGGGMAVFQAVRAFEIFSGRVADVARMQADFARLVSA